MGKELQAVVLAAGKGSRIAELTTSMPKCLLPIANKPMILYPLSLLEKAGFKEVLIIIPDNCEAEITKVVKDCGITVELFPIPNEQDWGTAQSLREAHKKIKNDFILISCDTIIVDFNLIDMINAYRLHYPTMMALISTTPSVTEGSVPGRKGKQKLDRDIVALERNECNRLILLSCEADFEEEIQFRVSTLRKSPVFEVHTNFGDAHVYIFQNWVLDYLTEKKHISVKGELIPSLIRKQFRNNAKLNDESKIFTTATPSIVEGVSEIRIGDELLAAIESLEFKKVEHLRNVHCYSYLLQDKVCLRANHLLSYMEANKLLSKSGCETPNTPSSATNANLPKSRAQVGNDCVIGSGTTFGEKTSVKKCIIGKDCSIGDKVRLGNCIIYDNVTIEENCNIQFSIICNGVSIGHSTEIKDSIISTLQKVNAYGKHVNEFIVHHNHLMQLY